MHFETEYCFACGMQGLDLRGPTSYIISLHGARQCNEHSLGQVPPSAGPSERMHPVSQECMHDSKGVPDVLSMPSAMMCAPANPEIVPTS